MVKKVKYRIIKKIENIEIRRYPRIIMATVHGLSDDDAFSILFEYISGKNTSREKIEMTAPVISSDASSEEIPMTAPVISGSGRFSFVMPSEYSMDNIPIPFDSKVKIEMKNEREVAVLKFRGKTEGRVISDKFDQLLRILKENSIQIVDEPFLMRYNPPFIPGFLRRNEIGIEISSDKL